MLFNCKRICPSFSRFPYCSYILLRTLRQTRFSMFHSRRLPSCEPDSRYKPFESIASEEMPSTCAIAECSCTPEM